MIKQVADIVGPKHTVDLKSYDLLILVEIYKVRSMCSYRSARFCPAAPRCSTGSQLCNVLPSDPQKEKKATDTIDQQQNICGVSVVGSDFEKLKKYNLAEIFEPTPRPRAAEKASKEG